MARYAPSAPGIAATKFRPFLVMNCTTSATVLRTALPGLGVAGILGFALNDSGIAVPGMMLGVVGASLAYLLVRTT